MHEYFDTMDKSGWDEGPWQTEPDKVQWVDQATGLDCLIVRNHFGALCGYVGVPQNHPAYEQGYDDVAVEVHGGLTFARSCDEPTKEEWLKIPDQLKVDWLIDEAIRFPKGDSARALKELKAQSKLTFEEWVEHENARRICHVPEPGRPSKVWWLGFDCAHAWDLSPGMLRFGQRPRDEVYRDIEYVKREVANLAQQLARMGLVDALDDVEV